MTIIDAHQHVWDLSQREVYDWPDEGVPTINRTMTLDEIGPAMHRAGVSATVLVQASDHAADTAHMLAVADAHPEVSFVGRLGTYRYYNMDQVVGQALAHYRRMSAAAPAEVMS